MAQKRMVLSTLLMGLLTAPLVLAQQNNIFQRALQLIFFNAQSVGGQQIYILYIRFIIFVVTFAAFYLGITRVKAFEEKKNIAMIIALGLALLAIIGIPDTVILGLAGTISTVIGVAWAIMLPLIIFFVNKKAFDEDTPAHHIARAFLYGLGGLATYWYMQAFFSTNDLAYRTVADWSEFSLALCFIAMIWNVLQAFGWGAGIGSALRGGGGGGRAQTPQTTPGPIGLSPQTEAALGALNQQIANLIQEVGQLTAELQPIVARDQQQWTELLAAVRQGQNTGPIIDALNTGLGEIRTAVQTMNQARTEAVNAQQEAQKGKTNENFQELLAAIGELRKSIDRINIASTAHQQAAERIAAVAPPDQRSALMERAGEIKIIVNQTQNAEKKADALERNVQDTSKKADEEFARAKQAREAAEAAFNNEMNNVIARSTDIQNQMSQIGQMESAEVVARLRQMKTLLGQVTSLETTIANLEKAAASDDQKAALTAQRKRMQELVKELADLAVATSRDMHKRAKDLSRPASQVADEVARVKKIWNMKSDPRVKEIDDKIISLLAGIDQEFKTQLQRFNAIQQDLEEEAKEFETLTVELQALAAQSPTQAYHGIEQISQGIDKAAAKATTDEEAEKSFAQAVKSIGASIQALIKRREQQLGAVEEVVVKGRGLKTTKKKL
jgi:hypothetical protein